ncbi:hypothetical protein AB0H17_22730 [Streptomyces olivoreticuli]
MTQQSPEVSGRERRDSTAERKRRRILLFAISPPIFLLIAGSGSFFAFGGYSRWQDERSLDRACQGLLPKEDVESLMGTQRLRGGAPIEARGGWLERCSVSSRGQRGVTEVNIGWRDETAGQAFLNLGHEGVFGTSNTAVPVGNGWSGTMTQSSPISHVSILSACRNSGKDLVVNVSSYPGIQKNLDTSKKFGSLTKVATEVTARATKKWDCDAKLGNSINSVTPPIAYRKNPVPVDQSTGTCRPVAPLAAEHLGGKMKVIETPVGNALIENCSILNEESKPLYHLAAFYGPYKDGLSGLPNAHSPAAGSDKKQGIAWARSECRSFFGTARFTITPDYNSSEDKPYEPADPDLPSKLLTAFTKEAAQRHGCTNLSLP